MEAGKGEHASVIRDKTYRLLAKIAEQERMIAILSASARRGEEAVSQAEAERSRRHELLKLLCETEVRLSYAEKEIRILKIRLRENEDAQALAEERRKRIEELEMLLSVRLKPEDPFGLSTPSSRRISKKNSSEENRLKRGGARIGHRGSGRRRITESEADRVLPVDGKIPPCQCGGFWLDGGIAEHSVRRFIPSRMENILYRKRISICSCCGRQAENPTPGAMPGWMYDNGAVANALVEHYLHGATAGAVARKMGIGRGTFFGIAHRTAGMLKPVFEKLLEELRLCRVIHADETGWTMDGTKAYAWLFANRDFRIFLFRGTRSSDVPKEALGENPELVLVTDRYSGYSPLDVEHQYCFVHLLRDVKKEEKNFPDDQEVLSFAAEMKPLLSEAIALRRLNLKPEEYTATAEKLRTRIMELCVRKAEHPAVQYIQNIFKDNEQRLFKWTRSPDIPADNNFAERELRPTVIARKISFGSQSEKGMATREILMSVLHTARCRGYDPVEFLRNAMDKLSIDKNTDASTLAPKIRKADTS